MLSLMYLFQIPDSKNLKMAIVSHVTCRLACCTAVITAILPRVVCRCMERGIQFSVLMPGERGKKRIFLRTFFVPVLVSGMICLVYLLALFFAGISDYGLWTSLTVILFYFSCFLSGLRCNPHGMFGIIQRYIHSHRYY